MKKEYTAPYAEKINFNYKDQVVASPSGPIKGECWYETKASYGFFGCVEKDIGGAMNN